MALQAHRMATVHTAAHDQMKAELLAVELQGHQAAQLPQDELTAQPTTR